MKRILFILLATTLCLGATGQTLPLLRPLPDCPFAHFERNRLLYPANDSSAMEGFFQKMDSAIFLGEGNVSIMHIGGSHVQAGVFTQQFRDNLLSISPDLIGGQNFVFPFSAGKNNPSHFITKSTGQWQYCRNAVTRDTDKRMGLAGAALTTTDPDATISIVTRAKYSSALAPTFDFNKVTLIGFSETKNVKPVVSYNGKTHRGRHDISHSTYTFILPSYTDSICISLESMPGEFTLTGILLENGMTGISVHGVGVNGASVPSYLRCDDFERDLALIRPDLVIFGIGINDATEKGFSVQTFKRNYGTLIDIIKQVNPDCALLFVTNNDSFKRIKKNSYEVNTNGKIVEQAFMEMGKKYGGAVWDQFDVMGGLKSMQAWEKAGLAQKDKVHFTREGYKLMGDLLYNALITKYIEHVKSTAKR